MAELLSSFDKHYWERKGSRELIAFYFIYSIMIKHVLTAMKDFVPRMEEAGLYA